MQWIIVLRLPHGSEYAFSFYQEQGKQEKVFALVPVEPSGVVRGAIAFESEAEAKAHLEAQLKAAPMLEKPGITFRVQKMLTLAGAAALPGAGALPN